MLESLLGVANLNRLQSLETEIPEHYTLDDIASRIPGSVAKAGRQETALEVVLYISRSECITWDSDQASKLVKGVGESLLSPNTGPDQEMAALVAEAGIACLHLISVTWSYNLDDSTLLKLVAFTDLRDPWVTNKAVKVASGLLREQLTASTMAGFIIGPVLQTFLKPLFAKSSSRVTASGRPAHYQETAEKGRQPPKTSSWKALAPWAISTLRWAVDASEPSLIKDHWPLFTPVLLALAEDESTDVKSRGLEILALFVGKCPAQILQTTGIGLIFEDVTFPALLYLPSLTPEQESTKLLVPAYDVLIRLAETHQPSQSLNRRRLLDKLLREGVFAAYFHASQYARLVQILMEMISSVMEDPFAMAYPPAILAATKALGVTITSCWPRFNEGENLGQIIRILSLCWLNVCGDDTAPTPDSDGVNAISRELVQTSNMLQSVWAQSHATPPEGLEKVLENEPRLTKLFPKFLSPTRPSAS
ncbi:hypothetical protein G7Z17_g8870 [Cylindrodendrum hubeiense]|uniref:ARM repeat superfamily protein n=1 Tax=Cylindrodendrum hubeiense TaxID=595255 RepID=A0A9P5H527_9HYPO|nr:hypothetical protein G7Z17_g8870 [Cylindrodendrum hubeiense]